MSSFLQYTEARPGYRWRVVRWGFAAGLLLLPWLAMRFTREVNWSGSDFAVFAAMLVAACGGYELLSGRAPNRVYRAAAALAVFGAFALVWINLAVGIIGSETNPANRLVAGVLGVLVVGTVVVRRRPGGMALVLIATATAQALVAAIAMIAGWGHALALTGCFVALWLSSAVLFHRAAQRSAEQAAAASAG